MSRSDKMGLNGEAGGGFGDENIKKDGEIEKIVHP